LDRVNPDVIRNWEAAFRYYPSLERNVFSYCIGVEPLPSLLRTKPEMKSVKLGRGSSVYAVSFSRVRTGAVKGV
jgi:hypothetical protein